MYFTSRQKLCTHRLGDVPFCRFFQALAGWGLSSQRTDILRSFQRRLIRIESRVGFRLLGHSRTSTELSISWCLGCVLRITLLLESKLSAQSEAMKALDQVFIKDFALFINPSTLTSLPAPVAELPTDMLLEVSPISTRDYWSSTTVTIGFLDLPFTKILFLYFIIIYTKLFSTPQTP